MGKSTRRAVEAAMKVLDYVPSSAARTLRSNRSGIIQDGDGGMLNNLLAGLSRCDTSLSAG